MKKILFLVLLLPFLIIGCGGGSTSGSDDTIQQHRPAAIGQANGQVYIESRVKLSDGGSFDNDGDISSYQWYDHNSKELSTDSAGNAEWIAPNISGQYTLSLLVSDSFGYSDTATVKISVVETDFMKSIVAQGGATYICVGDSTRDIAPAGFDGGHVFEAVRSALNTYGVTSILYAKHGYTARDFNNEKDGVVWFDWRDIEKIIPSTGETTIVDITLGINDVRYYNDEGSEHNIYADLSSAILKIKKEKPNTMFLLTMPNKIVSEQADYAEKSDFISHAYFRLSQDLSLPLIDTMGELFSGAYDESMYRTADGVDNAKNSGSDTRLHLSLVGQAAVAELILDRLLP